MYCRKLQYEYVLGTSLPSGGLRSSVERTQTNGLFPCSAVSTAVRKVSIMVRFESVT